MLDRLLITAVGAGAGYAIDKLAGGNGWTGFAVCGAAAFVATFVPPFEIGNLISFGKNSLPSLLAHAAQVADQEVTKKEIIARIENNSSSQSNINIQPPPETPTMNLPSVPPTRSPLPNNGNNNGGNNSTWDRFTDQRIRHLDGRIQGPATNFINRVHNELGINLRVVQGLRTIQEQNDLYAQGRTRPGLIVTRARGGQSFHNFGLAIDVAIVNPNGALNWNSVSPQVVEIARQEGFEWGGSWQGFPDRPHFQMTFGETLEHLRERFNVH